MKKLVFILFCSAAAFAQVPIGYNVDSLGVEGTTKSLRFFGEHMNYKENGKFKRISTWLNKDDLTGKFYQNRSSYSCQIPEYADEWFDFTSSYEEANITIKARPVASHIKGTLINDGIGNRVVYTDCFGSGKSLIVWALRGGLLKEIIVDAAPNPLADLSFEFEIDLPTAKTIKDAAGNVWDRASLLDFTGNTLLVGDPGKEIYFTIPMMWDGSGRKAEKVPIKFVKKGQTIYIRKTIPATFMANATFPVHTDHPTAYYSGTGDGWVGEENTSGWSTLRAQSSASSYNYASTTSYLFELTHADASTFSIVRGFLPFDTSALDDGATVTAASLYVRASSRTGTLVGSSNQFYLVGPTSQASTSTLESGDFDQCSNSSSPTKVSSAFTTTSLSTSARVAISLTDLTVISKTTYTKIGARSLQDADNVAPGASDEGNENKAQIYFAGYADTSYVPYLAVTASSAGGQVIIFGE